jgi:2'-5' RNA ligase
VLLEALRGDADLQMLPVRWQMPEGLHLTLAFLGESSSRQLATAWPTVARSVHQLRPATLTLLQPELFPNARVPTVIAAPIQDSRDLLQALQGVVLRALADGGYELEERTFRPHVSLGRLRPPLLRGQAAAIGAALRARQWASSGAFTAQSVCLMRSDLFPDGARYSVLAEATLGEPR